MKTFFPLIAALITTASAQISSPIINGRDTASGEFPSTVAILDALEPDNRTAQSCGGTLIHPRWVLTAAHCFTEDESIRPSFANDPRSFEVLVGTNDLEGGGRRVKVLRIIIHPDYDPVNSDNDIALLLLAEEVSDVPTTGLVRQDGFTDPTTNATVVGWGNVDPEIGEEFFFNILQKVDIPIASLEAANALDVYDDKLTENMLPAGDPLKEEDSCQGDSGGPLYVFDGNNSPLLAGITSFGTSTREDFACGFTFGIYTKVQNYTAWIDSYTTPTLAKWALANNLTASPDSDTDQDTYSDFEEYAYETNPRDSSDKPTTSISSAEFNAEIGTNRPQIQFLGESTPDLVTWTQPDTQSIEITASTPPQSILSIPATGDREFFRVRTNAAPSYEKLEPIALSIPGAISDFLAPEPTPTPEAGITRPAYTYQLTIPQDLIGSPISVTLRSPEFPAQLSISNAVNTATTTGADALGANPTDDLITFTPEANVDYLITVSTEQEDLNSGGQFTLAAFTPTPFPTITIGETQSGTLEAGDTLLPLPSTSGNYPSDTFAITGADFGTPFNVSIASDTNLTIEALDAETGRLLIGNFDDFDVENGFLAFFTSLTDRPLLIRVSQRNSETASTTPISYSLTLEAFSEISPGATLSGAITPDSSLDEYIDDGVMIREYFQNITLLNVVAGETYMVSATSPNFLHLLDISSAEDPDIEIEANFTEDADGESFTFTAEENIPYVIIILYDPDIDDSQTFGEFTLTVELISND